MSDIEKEMAETARLIAELRKSQERMAADLASLRSIFSPTTTASK